MKLIYDMETLSPGQLYDLRRDPGEKINLVDKEGGIAKRHHPKAPEMDVVVFPAAVSPQADPSMRAAIPG